MSRISHILSRCQKSIDYGQSLGTWGHRKEKAGTVPTSPQGGTMVVLLEFESFLNVQFSKNSILIQKALECSLCSKAGFDSVTSGEQKGNPENGGAAFPLWRLARSLLSSFLSVPLSAGRHAGRRQPVKPGVVASRSHYSQSPVVALGLRTSPGQGACQGDQRKREGLEFPLLGLPQAKNSAEIFGCVDACVQNGLILTLILG